MRLEQYLKNIENIDFERLNSNFDEEQTGGMTTSSVGSLSADCLASNTSRNLIKRRKWKKALKKDLVNKPSLEHF